MSHLDDRDAQLRALGAVLVLEQTLRRADRPEGVTAALVNDLSLLTPLEVAAVWRAGPGAGKVTTVLGLPEPVADAPFTVWCRRLSAHLAEGGGEARTVEKAALPADLQDDWDEFMLAATAWVPLRAPDGDLFGGLIVGRQPAWREEDLRLLGRLGETAAHALDRLERRRPALHRRLRLRPLLLGAAAVLLGALFLPVPLTVLAPAEIRSVDERVVRAPLEGVVGDVLVEPNQVVEPGQILLRFDDVALRTRLDKALQDLAIARAEFRQAQQTAMRDAEASSRQAVLAARVGQAQAEVGHLGDLLDRIEVRADRGGVVLIPDPQTLPGRPVRLGERLLSVADPTRVEAEIWMAVEDAVPLPAEAPVSLYLNVAPDDALNGHLRDIDYHAQEGPEGIFGFRGVADLRTGDTPPRIGLRGTARLTAGNVPLAVLIFRRPWAAVRPWLGL